MDSQRRQGAGGRILVVDDEPYLADVVSTALRYAGYEVEIAESSSQAQSKAVRFRPHLVVLDIMLPDASGLDTCQRIRNSGCDAPVIFLTARDSTADRIAGLRAGGDDYVTKPFSVEELMLRVQAVLRRSGHATAEPGDQLHFADLVLDEALHEVWRNGELIELTPTEYRLLRFLMVNAGRVLSKSQILEHVWEHDFGGNANIMHTYISYLRRKVDHRAPPLIHTVPGVGYVMRLPREQ